MNTQTALLLANLAEDHWKLVIEPVNEEETALIEEGMKEYENNPESFITLAEYKKSRGSLLSLSV